MSWALGFSVQYAGCRDQAEGKDYGQHGDYRERAGLVVFPGMFRIGQVCHWVFFAELILVCSRELGVAPRSIALW